MDASQVKSLINKYAGGTDSDSIKEKIEYFMLDDTLFVYTNAYTKMEIDGEVLLCYKEFENGPKSPIYDENNNIIGEKGIEFLSEIVDMNHIIVLHLARPNDIEKEKLNSQIVKQMLPME